MLCYLFTYNLSYKPNIFEPFINVTKMVKCYMEEKKKRVEKKHF